ncbi:MAG TPA: hypothetical protein PKD44_02660 [Nitrosomonas sp.]|nr:hypothetical protein [Nitrosomonas sp.]HMW68312.1 hypothetical protein [Nitrosomonas sp.]HND35980.1 hypothetical protein [Nitrosomonas sp.]HNE56886.1 hypothetical protein [Nitrosomonas sp.]HNH68233.1 hypothetical protein [Nitrosomonas sp.]
MSSLYRFLHHSFGIAIISNSFQLMVTIFCLLGGYITQETLNDVWDITGEAI